MKTVRKVILPILCAIPMLPLLPLVLQAFISDVLPTDILLLVLLLIVCAVLFPIAACGCGVLGILISAYGLYKRDSKVANIVWIVLFALWILGGVFYGNAVWNGMASV